MYQSQTWVIECLSVYSVAYVMNAQILHEYVLSTFEFGMTYAFCFNMMTNTTG